MNSTDPSDNMQLTVEWDKHEKQRARNRINQRNYRRRKSEQKKQSEEQKRSKSTSHSPAISSLDVSDYGQEESEMSSTGEAAMASYQPSFPPSTWQISTVSPPEPLESTLLPPDSLSSGSMLTGSWPASTSMRASRSRQSPETVKECEGWQSTANTHAGQLGTSGSPSQHATSPWSGPVTMAHSPQRSDFTLLSSHRGKTTLHVAAENGHSQTVSVLLFHGANPNVRDSDGHTALHAAASNGHSKVVAHLLSVGCDLDATNMSGQTALHLAAANNHYTVIDQLLRAGCNPNIQISNY